MSPSTPPKIEFMFLLKIGTLIWENYYNDAKRDYFILGSKYGKNNDVDIFPKMLAKSVISVGFASEFDLTDYFQVKPIVITEFLEKNGYSILETNWTFQKAEVDIIAKQKDTLAIIEVKTRSTIDFGNPQDFVKPKQIQNYTVRYKLPFALLGMVLLLVVANDGLIYNTAASSGYNNRFPGQLTIII